MQREKWSTKEEIAAARASFEEAIPGWQSPAAYGLGLSSGEVTTFAVVNNRGEHLLPGVVLATVCGHSSGTATYELSESELERAISLLEPAEACLDYDHPNVPQGCGELGHVVQGRGADDEVVAALGVEDPGFEIADVGLWTFAPCQPHHRAGQIDRVHMLEPVGEDHRMPAGAAAEVERRAAVGRQH